MKFIKEIGLKPPTKSKYGLYRCVCGKLFETQISRVKGGFTKSCGCLRNKKSSDRLKNYNTTHNKTGTRLHSIWLAMKKRCFTHKNYIKKNITVCKQWSDDFVSFEKWSLENGYSENLTIDREKNHLGYSPSNCRWTDMATQAQNRGKKKGSFTSRYKGVYLDKQSNKFISNITIKGTRLVLGRFDDEIEAKIKYDDFILENNLKHEVNK